MSLIDLDANIPLKDAVKLAFPAGGGTINTLRGLIKRGDLQAMKIGNRLFVTRRFLHEMKQRCLVNPKGHIYGLEKREKIKEENEFQKVHGISFTSENISPQDALNEKLNLLMKP